MSEEKIKVILLEPNKLARVTEIEHSLEAMQEIVLGDIQAVYPFDEEVCIVCNEEGKIDGLPLNRALYDENHEVYDIIAGPAFICDCSGESFGSLSEEQIKKYGRQFLKPERFFVKGDGVKAVPYMPINSLER